MSKILVTGAAGFIGMHLSLSLLNDQNTVIGLDNLNEYYDPSLKYSRLDILKEYRNFNFIKADLCESERIRQIVMDNGFDTVVNLAAQAGVRYSITNPEAYINSNLDGFFNILDASKQYKVPHFVYASSSSVYGSNKELPFSEADKTENPVSLYGATKKANELMAHSYSAMYGLKATGFRLFTAYGPYGRPDMALFIFTKHILEDKPIKIYNYGDMSRDFTYIDDIVGGIRALIDNVASFENKEIPYRVYNIGNSKPILLMDFVRAIEKELNKKAIIEYEEMQPGDVKSTYSDSSLLYSDTSYVPRVNFEEGVHRFVKWYFEYYIDR